MISISQLRCCTESHDCDGQEVDALTSNAVRGISSSVLHQQFPVYHWESGRMETDIFLTRAYKSSSLKVFKVLDPIKHVLRVF